MAKVIGDNHEGFANEKAIISYINNTIEFEKFNSNFKLFLTFLFNKKCDGKKFYATHGKKNGKTDVVVTMDGVSKNISVKTGSGNSVHQEPLNTFVSFLSACGASNEIIETLKYFHYGDGTIDGTGLKRYEASVYTKAHPSEMNQLVAFLNRKDVIEKIAKRVLITGEAVKDQDADVIFHGTISNAKWASAEEIINYLVNNKNTPKGSKVYSSNLTYQVWNRDLKWNPNTENRRHVSQFKWTAVLKDLTNITNSRKDNINTNIGTLQGDIQENDCVSLFNKNKNHILFNVFFNRLSLKREDNLYMVRVTTKQYSKLSNQVVSTRADAYCIKSNDEKLKEIVHRNNGYLDEDLLASNLIAYEKIPFSGISIKLDDSNNYQIIKLTPNSFFGIIGNREIGAGASLYCEKDKDLVKNPNIIVGWGSTADKIINHFPELNLSKDFYNKIEECLLVKNSSNKQIRELIDGNTVIQQKIFNGIGLYDEPYTAHFFFRNKTLSILKTIPYTITTGSGRSKGKYSIVLKP